MISPMLCQDTRGQFDLIPKEGWIIEPKLDGWRWLVHKDSYGKVKQFGGRNGVEYPGKALEIAAVLEGCRGLLYDSILDGELIATTADGSHSGSVSTVLAKPHLGELTFVMFDLLRLNGTDLTGHPWSLRRSLLETIAGQLEEADEHDEDHVRLQVVAPVNVDLHRFWLDAGIEGCVAKRVDSTYEPGKRSHDWLKCKPQMTADARIIGFEMGKGASNAHLVGAFQLRMLDSDVETSCALQDGAQELDVTGNREPWLGRIIELRHHGIMRSGKPRHPVFNRLRPDLEHSTATSSHKS